MVDAIGAFGMNGKYLKGDVGIGTLIVFIAMVLVAAVAAAVLLNVSGMLQQRASSTGKETTKQVSSNLMVLGVTGTVATGVISVYTLTVKASAGSNRIDLSNMLITLSNTTVEDKQTYITTGAGGDDTNYNVTSRIDPNNLFSRTTPIIDSSSLVDIVISAGDVEATTRTPIIISLQPEAGAPVQIEFTTPEVYSGTYVKLYP